MCHARELQQLDHMNRCQPKIDPVDYIMKIQVCK